MLFFKIEDQQMLGHIFCRYTLFWARVDIEQQQMKASQKVEAFLLPVLSSALILLYYYILVLNVQ